jgi:hypothetical protein
MTAMTHPKATANVARQAAYRRLALTILALDVPAVTAELQARRQPPTPLSQVLPGRRAA